MLDFVLLSALSSGISQSFPELTCWHVGSEPPVGLFLCLSFSLSQGFLGQPLIKGFVIESYLRDQGLRSSVPFKTVTPVIACPHASQT